MQQGFIMSYCKTGRLSPVSEKKWNFIVVCILTGYSKMLFKYYSSGCDAPLLPPFLCYTLAANMKARDGKNMNLHYLTVLLLSAFCTLESPF